jgi:hypothetical protein
MDFNVAFWHDGLNRFVDIPDYTLIAIAPLPRALKFTVTIWDRKGRDYEVFSQITWLPVGVGGAQPVSGAASYGPGGRPWVATDVDTKAYADADNDWAYSPTQTGSCYFNRIKQVVGDKSWNYGVNWNILNDTSPLATGQYPPPAAGTVQW